MAGLSGYNNDRIAHKPKIFIIWLFIEGFASADFIIPRGLLQLLSEDSLAFSIYRNTLSSEAACLTLVDLFPSAELTLDSL